ncbi:hypothetical protein B0H63DRAFT_385057 [Podospora didyma]|uniref:Uncharacterized protein n=1 Tax=Podospora didyma TaxID=330526 RepID=A0AAE0P800_9PEZI|nr:hypothetical protein B0H63DRAFT_385057 [Podospora didyma]
MPLLFQPKHDGRHRRACYALYRALLRHGPRVPLPNDIATGLGPEVGNPIKSLIRHGFYRNRNDISPRLVISALRNGYKFLDLLQRAADPVAHRNEHASVLSFLRENQERLLPHLNVPKPRGSAPNPGTIPLLTTIPPKYRIPIATYTPTRRPLPLSEIKGSERKVPRLEETYGFTFLRLTKPQPADLSRVLRQRVLRRRAGIDRVLELREVLIHEAIEEDRWDFLVENLQTQHARSGSAPPSSIRNDDPLDFDLHIPNDLKYSKPFKGEDTYYFPLRQALIDIQRWTTEELKGQFERGQTLWNLVKQERTLADAEARERSLQQKKVREGLVTKEEATKAVEALSAKLVAQMRLDQKTRMSDGGWQQSTSQKNTSQQKSEFTGQRRNKADVMAQTRRGAGGAGKQ